MKRLKFAISLLLLVFLIIGLAVGSGCGAKTDLTKNRKPEEVLTDAIKISSQWESNEVDELLSAQQGPLMESKGIYYRRPLKAHYEMKFVNPLNKAQVNLTFYIDEDKVYYRDSISGTWARASHDNPQFAELMKTLKNPTDAWQWLISGAKEVVRADDVKDEEGRSLAVFRITPDWKGLGLIGNLQASDVMQGSVVVKVQKDNLFIRGLVMEMTVLNPTEGPTELRYEITPRKINQAAPITIPDEAKNAPER